ncbi:hypothetical protein IM40_01035 [Candidatus Paracaedimonas acanthamoebae]|nr:hypothetical protein IM40_01035 [Candidatus Paracaedimonas acanthamoebae]
MKLKGVKFILVFLKFLLFFMLIITMRKFYYKKGLKPLKEGTTMRKLFIILVCFWWDGGVSCQASARMDIDDKENILANFQWVPSTQRDFKGENKDIPTSYDLEKALTPILDEIKKAYSEAERHALKWAYDDFMKLDYPDPVWADYAQQLKVDSWPAQTTGKERVGAHLFFPPHALEWFDCPYRNHLLKRFDYLWGFAISAKLNHSLGKYLLVDALHQIRRYEEPKLTPFFQEYLRTVVAELNQCLNHPDACYLLGRGQTGNYPYLISRCDRTLPEDELFRRHPDHLRNQYYALKETDDYWTYQESMVKKYLDLARQGYFPAYLRAADRAKDVQEKIQILTEASEKGYGLAFLELGYLYEGEQAVSCFQQAAENGISTGYIVLAKSLIGDPRPHMKQWRKDLTHLSQKEADQLTEQAAEYFKKAGEAHDPKGWEYLIVLWKERFETAKAQKDQSKMQFYWPKLTDAIQDGMHIGSAYAYLQAQVYFKKPYFEGRVRAYGYPPQGDIRLNWGRPRDEPVVHKSQSEYIEEFLMSKS